MRCLHLLLLTSLSLTACHGAPRSRLHAVSERLVAVMQKGLHRPDPTANVVRRAAGSSAFDGSYDWHSNLFASWALLVQARRTGDAALAAFVLDPLGDDALEAERGRVTALEHERMVTFPYDQSWLLMFLAEAERHRPTPTLREFRREVEARLVEWLQTAKFPENDNPDRIGGRRVVGWYRSWLFAWYQVWRSGPIGDGARERLLAMHRERIAPIVPLILEDVEPLRFEFVWVPPLAWLVHDVVPFDDFPGTYKIALEPLPDTVTLRTTHRLGVHLSRLWPLAILARNDDAARRELERCLAAYMAREDLWNGDFTVVSHWVPQFLWFTIWLASSDALPACIPGSHARDPGRQQQRLAADPARDAAAPAAVEPVVPLRSTREPPGRDLFDLRRHVDRQLASPRRGRTRPIVLLSRG